MVHFWQQKVIFFLVDDTVVNSVKKPRIAHCLWAEFDVLVLRNPKENLRFRKSFQTGLGCLSLGEGNKVKKYGNFKNILR